MPGTRRVSASRLLARIIILLGTQPQYGHSPPTSSASTPTTARPASARLPATSSPPGPMPMTTTSASRTDGRCSATGLPCRRRCGGQRGERVGLACRRGPDPLQDGVPVELFETACLDLVPPAGRGDVRVVTAAQRVRRDG